jgi:hypothetical protein
MKKLSIVLSALLLMITLSCNDNSNLTKQDEIKVNEKGITLLINYIDFNVNQLVANGFNDYGNHEAIANNIANNNIAFEKQYGVSMAGYSDNARSSVDEQLYQTEKDSEFAKKLMSLSKISSDENDYLSNLSNLKTEIYSYSVDIPEKQILMSKVVFMEKLIQYMNSKATDAESKKISLGKTNAKADPANPPANGCNWWCSWGKCAASIAGGALTGAVAGCASIGAIGAIITSPTGPGMAGGAATGCAVGGIVGGIGGGLTGAAAGCD